MVGASFLHSTIKSSIIPDGFHADYAAVKIAKAIMKERLFAITDAVTETTTGAYPHQLNGDKYEAGGILSGSALNMHKAVNNLVAHCGIEKEEAIRMAGLYPAQVMKMDDSSGSIAKGAKAKLLSTDADLSFVALIE